MAIRPLDTLLAFKAINLVSDLNNNDRRVAAALLEHFNRRTGQCDPSLNRLAKLLGISTRTVIRSIQRLEKAGLFKKTRHGGFSNRNFYEPNWPRFREIETAWCTRFNAGQPAPVSEASPASRQSCHVEGDHTVTQTYRSNLPRETYQKGLPREEKGRGLESRSRLKEPTSGGRPRDAAETAAERRWSDALLQEFGSWPRTYGEVIDAITPEIQAGATKAEMRRAGAGLEYVLDQLHLRGSAL